MKLVKTPIFNTTSPEKNVGLLLQPTFPGRGKGTITFKIRLYKPGDGYQVETEKGHRSIISIPNLLKMLEAGHIGVCHGKH